ncbi:MAG: thiamine phosphate synthase, partial [Alphaproteobacteria bacterium]
GQNDLPPTRARKSLGARAIIGYSIENPNQLSNQTPDQLPHQLEEYKASDYLGVGPIFATPSKADAAPPLGLDTLAAMASLSSTTPVPPVPVVAIGGISTANVSDVWRTGVAGIAVISAITRATCCQEAARQLLAPSIPLHPTPSPTPSQIADAR